MSESNNFYNGGSKSNLSLAQYDKNLIHLQEQVEIKKKQ